jgi:signal transduction histidine kinase
MACALRILLIEDNPGDARLTCELLREARSVPVDVAHAPSFGAGVALLAAEEFAVVLLDLSLPDMHGHETVRQLHARHPRVPLIVLTGLDDEETAIEALHNGAQDYLVKGHGDGQLITRAIRYAIERKRGELQLTEAKELAESASRAKSTFLAHMSHELRTPLNAVIGFSDIIAKGIPGLDSAEVCREYARYINASGQHLLKLVNDILDLSKLTANHLVLHESPVDLSALMHECIELVSCQAAEKEIAITVAAPGDVGLLTADELRLKQVLINLLSNAVKFSKHGGAVEIILERRDDADPVIAVRDRGIGMRPEEIPIALEPFQQVETDGNAAPQGTGLGLPLARLLVEKHGGRLTVASAVGVGTTVYLALPRWRLSQRSGEAPLRRTR